MPAKESSATSHQRLELKRQRQKGKKLAGVFSPWNIQGYVAPTVKHRTEGRWIENCEPVPESANTSEHDPGAKG